MDNTSTTPNLAIQDPLKGLHPLHSELQHQGLSYSFFIQIIQKDIIVFTLESKINSSVHSLEFSFTDFATYLNASAFPQLQLTEFLSIMDGMLKNKQIEIDEEPLTRRLRIVLDVNARRGVKNSVPIRISLNKKNQTLKKDINSDIREVMIAGDKEKSQRTMAISADSQNTEQKDLSVLSDIISSQAKEIQELQQRQLDPTTKNEKWAKSSNSLDTAHEGLKKAVDHLSNIYDKLRPNIGLLSASTENFINKKEPLLNVEQNFNFKNEDSHEPLTGRNQDLMYSNETSTEIFQELSQENENLKEKVEMMQKQNEELYVRIQQLTESNLPINNESQQPNESSGRNQEFIKNLPDGKLKDALTTIQDFKSTITEIYLGEAGIGNEGAIALAEALKLNQTLTTIHLQDNSIGNEGGIALAEALKLNQTLTTIDLGYNSIGKEGAIALAEALKLNKTLISIDISLNSIGVEGGKALAEALKLNQTLTTIDLQVNSIGDEEKQEIKNGVMKYNKQIKFLI